MQGEKLYLKLADLAMALHGTPQSGKHAEVIVSANSVEPELTEPLKSAAAQFVSRPTPQCLDVGAAFGQLPCFGFPTMEAAVLRLWLEHS